MPSGSGELNFTYNHNVTTAKTWTTKNFYVENFMIGSIPNWVFLNKDKDNTFMGTNGMPAEASLILYAPNDHSPTTYTLYWGSGAHHRHHDTYRGTDAKGVIKIDWATPNIEFVGNFQNKPQELTGNLPWIPNQSSTIVSEIEDAGTNSEIKQEVQQKTRWFRVNLDSADGADLVDGSMTYDLFLVKADNGCSYLRINFTQSSIGFDSNEEQQFVRFGILPGDQSQLELFTQASKGKPFSWNDDITKTLNTGNDPSVLVPEQNGFAPVEDQETTGSYTKTTSSGWSVGAKAGGSIDAGGSGDSGSSASGDSGASSAAEDAALIA
ncbi:hypothetical protein [Microbulbifer sp. YPW16]|uniref:hypothetical protein n=1 Tax=Microbulbifer sp. YPW16 TaxID=2904242 RepID=UPI001E2B73CD|nr:hypothetical protein [Microbulbifer sp. YPW16]UHQ54146.1 hypothetical protein LVE68_11515 [Microbulbifer sp. YPW16]